MNPQPLQNDHPLHEGSAAGSLSLRGGALCLDFTNTVSSRGFEDEVDRLEEYVDLLAWGAHADALDAEMAALLDEAAAAEPDAATGVLARAVALREAIFRIVDKQIAGRAPAGEDLAVLNREVGRALAHLRVQSHESHYDWGWDEGRAELDRPLWPVARSAAELLTSEELGRVHKCASDSCGWLFLDRSKNHSRRWCDMKDCGNVAKVRRYRTRRKSDE